MERIFLIVEKDIIPAFQKKGSVGASGDLCLYHLTCILPLIGEGKVCGWRSNYFNKRAFSQTQFTDLYTLSAKEGFRVN